jgi:Right handed beta helix region
MRGFFTTQTLRCKWTLTWLLSWLCVATPCFARVWEVGPSRALTGPGAVASMVRDGDVVILDPGIYRDCAIWRASGLTIQGRDPPASVARTMMTRPIITGPACADRALFYFVGNNITVRGLTFLHARDSAHNGAGILMEGANLTVSDSQFLDNENGILAGGPDDSVIQIANSLFRGNGACEGACAHALYAGRRITRLDVRDSTFLDTHVGHGIKSRALKTIVTGCRIEDGETGTSSYLIELPEGGDAEIVDNVLEKGPRSENKEAAISIGVPGRPAVSAHLDIRGNRFTNDMPDRVAFVRNQTNGQAILRGNTVTGPVRKLEGPGSVE